MNTFCRITLLVSSLSVVAFGLLAYYSSPFDPGGPIYEMEMPSSSDSPWRLTKNGWEDSRTWRDIQAESKALPPAIHPLIWSLGVLLLSLGAMIWSSEDDGEVFTPSRRNQNQDPEVYA